MKFRTYKNSDLTVSEVGFGMWTISTGWWGNYTEGEALALMRKAFDLGVTLFDAADTYGNGLSEERGGYQTNERESSTAHRSLRWDSTVRAIVFHGRPGRKASPTAQAGTAAVSAARRWLGPRPSRPQAIRFAPLQESLVPKQTCTSSLNCNKAKIRFDMRM